MRGVRLQLMPWDRRRRPTHRRYEAIVGGTGYEAVKRDVVIMVMLTDNQARAVLLLNRVVPSSTTASCSPTVVHL
jgi:hypothetical protein